MDSVNLVFFQRYQRKNDDSDEPEPRARGPICSPPPFPFQPSPTLFPSQAWVSPLPSLAQSPTALPQLRSGCPTFPFSSFSPWSQTLSQHSSLLPSLPSSNRVSTNAPLSSVLLRLYPWARGPSRIDLLRERELFYSLTELFGRETKEGRRSFRVDVSFSRTGSSSPLEDRGRRYSRVSGVERMSRKSISVGAG